MADHGSSPNDPRPTGNLKGAARPVVHDSAPVMNATEARQGSEKNRVRWVLIIGVALVVVGFAVAFMASTP